MFSQIDGHFWVCVCGCGGRGCVCVWIKNPNQNSAGARWFADHQPATHTQTHALHISRQIKPCLIECLIKNVFRDRKKGAKRAEALLGVEGHEKLEQLPLYIYFTAPFQSGFNLFNRAFRATIRLHPFSHTITHKSGNRTGSILHNKHKPIGVNNIRPGLGQSIPHIPPPRVILLAHRQTLYGTRQVRVICSKRPFISDAMNHRVMTI